MVGWISDGGSLDSITIALYGLAAVLYLRTALITKETRTRTSLGAGVLALACLAFLEASPARWTLGKFSPLDAAPPDLLEHAVAWAVPLTLAAVGTGLLAANRKRLRKGVAAGEAPFLLWSLIPVLLGVAFVLDRIQGTLSWPNPGWETVAVDRGTYFTLAVFEETIETMVPVVFLTALILWRRSPAVRT